MDRPRLLPGQVQALEQLQHAVLAVADAEAVLDQVAQILGPPAAHAVAFRVRATQDQGLEGRHLAFVQPWRPPAARPVVQTLDAVFVEADHPIAQRLPVHAGLARGPFAAHAVEHVGERQQPARHPAVGLEPRQPAQLLCWNVAANRYRRAHRFTSLHHHAAS